MFSDPEKNIEQLHLGEGNYVADFGAGSGFYSFAAAEAVGTSGHVYSLDIQKDLLEKLKKEAQFRKLDNIDIIWSDFEHVGGTKLRDSSMDFVILANILFQIEKKEVVILEAKRILKRSGKVLVVDWASSFGGLGPQTTDVFSKEQSMDLFIKKGFSFDKEILAGAQHYGLIFKNNI